MDSMLPLTREERREPVSRLFKQLDAERKACVTCMSGTLCKEPHAKPCKTIAWAMDTREYTIVRDIQLLIEEWRARSRSQIDEYHEIVLKSLSWAEKEAVDAWERSKQQALATATTTETVDAAGTITRRTRAQRHVRQQTGHAQYMSTFMAVQMQRREMLGLDAPKRTVLLNPDGSGLLEGLLRSVALSAASNVIDVTPQRQRAIEYLDVDDVPVDNNGNGTHAGNNSS